MEEFSQKYILVQNCEGYTEERNLLFLGLSTKQTPTQVLRGELFEDLPPFELNLSRKPLVGIDRKSLRLELGCFIMACIRPLTEEDANLLLAISSLEERYRTYADKALLDCGRNIGIKSEVFVTVKGVSRKLPGIVRYKGELPSCNGTMFGVELTVSMYCKVLLVRKFNICQCEFDVPPNPGQVWKAKWCQIQEIKF